MTDVSEEMREQLATFNRSHRAALQKTARALLSQGIRRVHYGVDYVNDDGEEAQYAVLEYADGRIEELDEWFAALDEDLFAWGVRFCEPYTFEVSTASVIFDEQGGSVDTEGNTIRMYHSPARRETLEAEAEEFARDLTMFSYSHYDALQPVGQQLKTQGIERVYFGVDHVRGANMVSAWGFLRHSDGREEQIGGFPSQLEGIREVLDELPDLGAFAFTDEGMFESDEDGGILELGETTKRAYHTPEQRLALERTI
jgi:hypothetical protein